jgi:protein-tyrosine-phosphatase
VGQCRFDIAGQQPTSLETADHEMFDFINMCDKAREHCPELLRHPGLIHWGMADPAAEGDLAGYSVFERTAADLETRIRFLLPVLQGISPAPR